MRPGAGSCCPIPGRGAGKAGVVAEFLFHEGELHGDGRCKSQQSLLYRVEEGSFSTDSPTDDDHFGSVAPGEIDDADRDIFDDLHPDRSGADIAALFESFELFTRVGLNLRHLSEVRELLPEANSSSVAGSPLEKA